MTPCRAAIACLRSWFSGIAVHPALGAAACIAAIAPGAAPKALSFAPSRARKGGPPALQRFRADERHARGQPVDDRGQRRGHRGSVPATGAGGRTSAPCRSRNASDAGPRVGRGVGELLVLAVEERVRRALVDDDLVLDAGAVSASSNAALSAAVMFASSPAWSARIGAVIWRGQLDRAGLAVALAGRRRRSRPRRPGRGRPRRRATSCRPPKQNPTVKIAAQLAARGRAEVGDGRARRRPARPPASSARRAPCTGSRRRASRRRPCGRSSRTRSRGSRARRSRSASSS